MTESGVMQSVCEEERNSKRKSLEFKPADALKHCRHCSSRDRLCSDMSKAGAYGTGKDAVSNHAESLLDFGRGATYEESHKYKEAIEAYKRAIQHEPDFAGAHFELGVAYVESGMHNEAIAAYKEAIRLEPGYSEAYYALGVAYLVVNNRDAAFQQHEKLKQLNSQMAEELFTQICVCDFCHLVHES